MNGLLKEVAGRVLLIIVLVLVAIAITEVIVRYIK